MKINLAGMKPADSGVERGVWSVSTTYLGGRLHGGCAGPGWLALTRDENGRDIDAEVAGKVPHYRLYVAPGGCLNYVHSSLNPSVPDEPAV